jgi:predicted 2-oxoglutarate/Fe(II)-dependent dioxygenase YbiX
MNMNKPLQTNDNLQEQLIFNNAFMPEECEFIIKSAGLRESSGVNIAESRFSKSYPMKQNSQTEWIKNRLVQIIDQANQLYYHFNIKYLENMQFLEYYEKGLYDWHIDIAGTQEKFWTRKINAVLFLSDRKTYEGGQLIFNLGKTAKGKSLPQDQGSVILFPSYQPHKVEPVTRGIRYTLSAIAHGDSFK